MKILIFAHHFYPSVGGVEITAELLARGFTEQYGDEVTVVTEYPSRNAVKNFPFTVVRKPSFLKLRQLVRESDVIFHNNPVTSYIPAQIFSGKPSVMALRSWITEPEQKISLKYALKYSIIENADYIIANGSPLAGHVRGPVKVIHNSYRDWIFQNHTPYQDRRLEDILYVGRLHAEKGIDLLLRALAVSVRSIPNISLTIIGGGSESEENYLRKQISDLDLDSRVNILGRMDGEGVATEMNKRSIVVVPSRYQEPFGTVAIEAIAAGCIPIVAGHGGLPEAAGEAGITFRPGDAEDLAREITDLLLDSDRISDLRGKQEAHAQNHRTEIMVDAYRSVLEEAYRGGSRFEKRIV